MSGSRPDLTSACIFLSLVCYPLGTKKHGCQVSELGPASDISLARLDKSWKYQNAQEN